MAPAQKRLDQALANLSSAIVDVVRAVVAEAIETEGAPRGGGRPATTRASAAAPGRRRRTRAAIAAEQRELETRLLRSLEAADRPLSASEIQERLREEAGPVRAAIRRLKDEDRLIQEGQRRGARYRIREGAFEAEAEG